MSKRTLFLALLVPMLASSSLRAQQGTPIGVIGESNEGTDPGEGVAHAAPPEDARVGRRYWRPFVLGFAASILVHEAGHVGAALALGGRPGFGFDRARPTIYSGLNEELRPHQQFLFSSAGLTVQALLDELILDVPHGRGSPFERGILAGGIGTTVFYLTIGRSGSVSDVDFMARTSGLSKTQLTLIYGGVAAMHSVRIARDGRYANFFARPDADGRVRIGIDLR